MEQIKNSSLFFYSQTCGASRDKEFKYAIKFFELTVEYGFTILGDVQDQSPRCEIEVFGRLVKAIEQSFEYLQNTTLLKKAVKYGDNCYLSWNDDIPRYEKVININR